MYARLWFYSYYWKIDLHVHVCVCVGLYYIAIYVCIEYTVLDRVIGLLLTKYFKRMSLLKLHLPVGDVPFPFPCNWSNNARGHPLSRLLEISWRSRKSFRMHITIMKLHPKETHYTYSLQERRNVFWLDLYTSDIYCSYISPKVLVVDLYLARYAGFLASKCLFMFALSRRISHRKAVTIP